MMTLAELLGLVACEIEPYASTRGVRVEPRAEGFALLAGDPHKLRQALSRLLHAAIERSNTGTIVQARAALEQGRAVFLVEDESGLPLPGGHLGVSIARAIIERQGGSLRMGPDEGSSACARAELPCLGEAAPWECP
jgi:signal transduction histidine kinase